jgi:hypothetical protein
MEVLHNAPIFYGLSGKIGKMLSVFFYIDTLERIGFPLSLKLECKICDPQCRSQGAIPLCSTACESIDIIDFANASQNPGCRLNIPGKKLELSLRPIVHLLEKLAMGWL